ncbi:MAG: sulfotransferase [Pseudomonadota bacterium]
MSKESTNTQSPLAVIEARVRDKDFGGALTLIYDHLANDTADPSELMYMQAVCLRYLGRFQEALTTLEQLKHRTPNNGRAHQEEGHNRRELADTHGAILAYNRATQLNPALTASWQHLHALLNASGQTFAAAQVREHIDHFQQMPKPLLAVTDLIAQGKLIQAEELCRRVLQQVPDHTEGMRLLADIGSRLGVLDDAEFLLESAVAFEPDNPRLRIDYVRVLRKRQKFELALSEAKTLLHTNPANPRFKSLVAVESMQTGDFDSALTLFNEVLSVLPQDPITLTSRGHALKTAGQYQASVDSYHDAIRYQPDHGEAWYSLANLKTYRFTQEEVEDMEKRVKGSNLSHMDRVYFYFALAKSFEDSERYDLAFDYYRQGNDMKRAQSRYDADRMHEDLQRQIETCTPDLFEHKNGHDASDPIFILGLPRAGSTLLEQILSSHSQVDGTLELPNILTMAHRLGRGKQLTADNRYPDVLKELDDEQLRALGEEFIRDTAIHRQGAPYFIDKMPNNFRHIGLIRLILPNAKIIDARRHPMACCFSGFKQLFAEGQEFTYSLSDIGQYYRDYVALMDHWDQVLPGFVYRVQHEELVADPEDGIRSLLDFCGLPFEEACLNFHETERAVRTPSSEQVRQPIFTSSLDQWSHFEPYLGTLKAALGDLAEESE